MQPAGKLQYPAFINQNFSIFFNLPDKPDQFGTVFAPCASINDKKHQKQVPIHDCSEQIREPLGIIRACCRKLLPKGVVYVMELDHIEQVRIIRELGGEFSCQRCMAVWIADG